MDFELHYTQEQEEFRKEVQAWLDANIPKDVELPEDPDDIEPDTDLYKLIRECRRKLAQKGWWAPTWPKEYGGGGLSMAQAMVIDEELDERPLSRFGAADNGSLAVSFSGDILVWGTEEQKKRFLPLLLSGTVNVWQGYTEPEAGSDLASLKTTAIRDGDDYILNGEKVFAGTKFPAEYILVLAVTDPEAPRHRNIGQFLVPTDLPGINIKFMPLLSYGCPGKRHIFFDNVRVPAMYQVGPETDGWKMTQTHLEVEHGGGGSITRRDRILDNVLAYCKETKRNGQPLSKDPDVRNALVEIYIQGEIGRLFGMRMYWMRHTKKRGVGYEGTQNHMHRKASSQQAAALYNEVLGPAVLMKEPKWAIVRGALEYMQQTSMDMSATGSFEVDKLIMARRMGISKTRETTAAYV
ncbi:acyl-CoA dehydrogenase family protein [Chloroflexota bacterium]